MRSYALIFAAFLAPALASSVHPTKSEAYAVVKEVLAIKPFIKGWADAEQSNALTTCRARVTKFTDECPSDVDEDTFCKNYRCNGGSHCAAGDNTNQSTCEALSVNDYPCSYSHDGEKESDFCCLDGDFGCEGDADGDEYRPVGIYGWKCCNECMPGPDMESHCETTASEVFEAYEAGKPSRAWVTICPSINYGCRTCTGRGKNQELVDGERDGLSAEEYCEQKQGICTYELNGVTYEEEIWDHTPCPSGICMVDGEKTLIDGWQQVTDENQCASMVGKCEHETMQHGNENDCINPENGWCEPGRNHGMKEMCEEDGGTWRVGTWTAGSWVPTTWTPAKFEDISGISKYDECDAPGTGFQCFGCSTYAGVDHASENDCLNSGVCSGSGVDSNYETCDQHTNKQDCINANKVTSTLSGFQPTNCSWIPNTVVEVNTASSRDDCEDNGGMCMKCSDDQKHPHQCRSYCSDGVSQTKYECEAPRCYKIWGRGELVAPSLHE